MRLIDADALIDDVDGDLTDAVAERIAIEKIKNAPTIDAVPVVHCYECIHRGTSRCTLTNDYNDYYTGNPGLVSGWFCADGERRE